MVLLYIIFACLIVQIVYTAWFFVCQLKNPEVSNNQVSNWGSVSIIICAKNEGINLAKYLPVVLSQVYDGAYEVIVVNDGSNDDTGQVLKILKSACDNLTEVIISSYERRNLKGKKYALSKGVAIAKYDWLLLIDADCMPASESWLRQMVAPLANGKEIVAGYGGYNEGAGLLNAFTRWETVHTFIQYSAYAGAGHPYMAVGRNMACTKEVFLKARQSKIWNEVPSGDDDLLVSICGTGDNMAVVAAPSAFTWSDAKDNWKDWIAQKQRHLSTGKYYKWPVQLMLGAYGLSHALMWIGLIALLLTPFWPVALCLLGLRSAVVSVLWLHYAGKLKEKSRVYLFPLFDIGWMLYNFAFLPYITWKNKKTWT